MIWNPDGCKCNEGIHDGHGADCPCQVCHGAERAHMYGRHYVEPKKKYLGGK